jgi:hypothetical protein
MGFAQHKHKHNILRPHPPLAWIMKAIGKNRLKRKGGREGEHWTEIYETTRGFPAK